MSYQVLARKWRPATFKEMVGQEYIVRMMSNALTQNRLHHAYLFTGTRGVGKTTLARILAKCLNCEKGVTAEPCGTCHYCQAIEQGKFLDLYEIDAASRTKVEDTRELLDNVLYPPTQGRYKIYLIDEVHMLSNHSFNALLKTLEEPPEYVKFLLATTDPKRLPITILSRCLQFHLKQITKNHIAQHLQVICEKENIQFETLALAKLAKAAHGSMRDALSLLDQAIAYGDGKVNLDDVNTMLGSVSSANLVSLLDALAVHDNALVFKHCKEIASHAPDYQQIFEELIYLLHQIALAQVVADYAIDDELKHLTKQFRAEDLQLYYQIALLGKRDLAYTPTPEMGFEMCVLRLLAFQPGEAQQHTIHKNEENEEIQAPTPEPAATISTVIEEDLPTWRELLPKLELQGMAYALASNCTLQSYADSKMVLALSENHTPMLNQKLKERIAEALCRYLKKPVQLEIKPTSTEINTPSKQAAEEAKAQLAQGKENILQHPKVKKLLELYDATVDVSLT